MWKILVTCTDGTQIEYDESSIIETGISISSSISSSDAFALGNCSAATCTLKIADALAHANDFYHATVEVKNGEKSKGKFVCNSSDTKGGVLTLDCYDYMIYAGKQITTQISGKTFGAIAASACDGCGLELKNQSWAGANRECTVPDTSKMTYRDLFAYIAQATGNYCRVDEFGAVVFDWFDADLTDVIDGGVFDEGAPYQTGSNIDGGDFSYTSSGDADGGTFLETASTHTVLDAFSLDIGTDEICITGVRVKNGDSESLAGQDGYVLSVEDNQFTEGKEEEYAQYIAARCVGLRLRTFSAKIQENDEISVGDALYITDAFNTAYKSYITSITYTAYGQMSIACEAASPVRQEMQRSTVATKILQKADQSMNRKLLSYDQTAQNMTSLISQGFGLYTTTTTDESGAVKQYLHDKPTLEASSVVWTRTAQGLMVSKDCMTSWAIDSNGNALFNVLTAHGINADWVRVGGQGNGDGQITVKNAAGDTIILLNNAGITMADGTSLINASGVCGDLTFTSGGTPYDLGFAGNIVTTGSFIKQDVLLQAYIPENYVITSAVLVLSTCATSWTSVMDDSGGSLVYNTCTGYPRGIKAYIGAQQMYKSAVWDSEYTLGTSGAMSQIISGGFTSAGVDGSATTSPKQIKSGNIKSMLKAGLNTIRFTVADFAGSTNLSYAQRTGTATALLSIKGYTKN